MSTVDLRGFRYALEPLLRRQRWRLEAQQLKLAALQQQIERCGASLRALEQTYRQRAEDSVRALVGGFDLVAHQRSLAYLAQLRGEILAGAEQLECLRQQGREQRAACAQLQRRLDLLEQHRADLGAGYLQEEGRRQDNEMDKDWLSRSLWRAQAGEELA
jgi:flagellar biosynthesis chaperone FliJ